MIGTRIIRLDEINSTNDFIKVNHASLSHGTICTALVQTAGRGRRENIWMSEKGNLYFSFLLKEHVTYQNVFTTVARTSVAVVHALESLGLDSFIKYPNDILVNRKKIAGILVETFGSKKLDHLIIGVGLNVNQHRFTSLADKATSILQITGKKTNIADILSTFIEKYNNLATVSHTEIMKLYRQKSYVMNKKIMYKNKQYTIDTILNDGNLQLSSDEGLVYVGFNEISLEELYDQ